MTSQNNIEDQDEVVVIEERDKRTHIYIAIAAGVPTQGYQWFEVRIAGCSLFPLNKAISKEKRERVR